jgi:antitoxin component YwqK of YwqJK toxin-antitoxin module
MRNTRALAIAVLAISGVESIGCWSINKREGDIDRSPVVNTGAGATIIYPGQAAPAHPGNYHPREAGYGQGVLTNPANPANANPAYPGNPANPYPAYPANPGAAPNAGPPATTAGSYVPPGAVASSIAVPPPEYGSGRSSSTGSAAPRGSNIAMLGGAETEETKHVRVDEEPKFLKYLALPFAVLAAPVKYGADKLAGEPEPGPPVPTNESQPRPEVHPAAAPTDYETARLQGIDRELAERERPVAATAPSAPSAPSAAPDATAASFADELAALRRRANPTPAPAPAPIVASAAPVSAPPPSAISAPPVAATGQVDRDGDGRTDHWITRENGAIAREAFDENFDGKPDRTITYDPASHEAVQIEEDTNFDGRSDAWTTLRGGQIVGRRVDTNGDGQVDSWSFYQGGVITRLERDSNGDGFRDHVAYYQDGRLVREERDDDGDGRTDLITYFDAGEQVSRVEEDTNGDGEMDVISYYDAGRLARREVLDASVLGAGPRKTERE